MARRGGFPHGFFGQFPGGFDGGDFGRGQPSRVSNSKYYELLGVPKTIDPKDVRKVFRDIAKKAHPDKGGDPAKFAEISQAADVLSDPVKKKVYDTYGEEGLNKGIKNADGPMGGLFGHYDPPRKLKAKPIVVPVDMSLESVFNGCRKTVEYTTAQSCPDCKGIGYTRYDICPQCHGQGNLPSHHPLGITMRKCPYCLNGLSIHPQDACRRCRGRKFVQIKKTIVHDIEKGVPPQFEYLVKDMGDCPPGMDPGDVELVIRSSDYGMEFRRRGVDLILRKMLTLVEALTGYSFMMTYLDGTKHLIYSKPGEIVTPGMTKTIEDMGMPVFRDPIKHGNLFVVFEVEYPGPNNLTYDVVDRLRGAFEVEDNIAATEWDIPPENVHQAEGCDIRYAEKRPESILNKQLPRKPSKSFEPQSEAYYQGQQIPRQEYNCSSTIF